MREEFKVVQYERKSGPKYNLDFLNLESAKKVQSFHASFPVYKETPLVELKHTAKSMGLGNIYIKDESYRFGLNAFKVLGGSYAIGNYLAKRLGKSITEMPYEKLVSGEIKRELGDITFVTATDGNHGRGVAWTAKQLQQKSVVYMPKGSAEERLMNIRAEGADASITDLNYDEAVRLANSQAEQKGWVMVQDTAWEGYEDIPGWIMQGYGTMGYEAYMQLPEKPTHIFLQAGVGSMAGAVAGFFASVYGGDRPIITIVEPNKADCIYKTAEAADGKLHFVTGDMDTIMAGLACGEPNILSWDILRNHVSAFVSCPDWVSARGMRMLGVPVKGDPTVISGESGAVGMGLIAALMETDEYQDLREAIGLDRFSQVLLFSTEGNTDPMKFRKVLWDGEYPTV